MQLACTELCFTCFTPSFLRGSLLNFLTFFSNRLSTFHPSFHTFLIPYILSIHSAFLSLFYLSIYPTCLAYFLLSFTFSSHFSLFFYSLFSLTAFPFSPCPSFLPFSHYFFIQMSAPSSNFIPSPRVHTSELILVKHAQCPSLLYLRRHKNPL